jgi:methylase of polypeptide subunit release factors
METAPAGRVLELCCGAGQIGLLAVGGADRELVMVDASPAACELARRNATAAGLADRVEVREGDLGRVVRPDEQFAVVIADPPYLTADEAARYPGDPPLAVLGGADDLELARACVRVVRDHLLPGGSAVLQLRDTDQVATVRDLLGVTGDLVVAGSRPYDRGVLALLRRR